MNFKKTGMLLLIMSVLLVAAAGGVLRAEDNTTAKGTPCPKKVAVVLETVKTAVFLEFQFSGQGKAQIIAVKSPVGGVLSEVKVSEGSLVDAGQELAVLNAGTNAEIKKLEAAAAKAKKVLATRQGWKDKNEKAVQSAAKDYQNALNLLNKAKAQISPVVKAPVAGIVHLVMAAGSEIAANALLLEISNPQQMQFPISLTASDKGLVKVGDQFVGTTEGFSGEVFAEVISVSASQAVLGVSNADNKVNAGVTFTFKKREAEHADAIVIPNAAVQHDNLGDYVYVAEGKKARKLYVILGTSRAGKTMVLKGLVTNSPLIISGVECLNDGKKIRIVNQEELNTERAEAKTIAAEAKAETLTPAEKPEVKKEKRFRAGLTFGRFSINDKNMRAFYGDWFKNIPGIEVSAHIMYNVDIWAAYKKNNEEQTTTYFKNPVKFKLVPLSVGLRYRFPKWRFLEPFVGAGLNFYSYKETIEGETALQNTKGTATGFHFQGGTYFHVNSVRFLLGELFVKYNMVKKTLAELLPDGSDQLDLGGLEVGIGVVARF